MTAKVWLGSAALAFGAWWIVFLPWLRSLFARRKISNCNFKSCTAKPNIQREDTSEQFFADLMVIDEVNDKQMITVVRYIEIPQPPRIELPIDVRAEIELPDFQYAPWWNKIQPALFPDKNGDNVHAMVSRIGSKEPHLKARWYRISLRARTEDGAKRIQSIAATFRLLPLQPKEIGFDKL